MNRHQIDLELPPARASAAIARAAEAWGAEWHAAPAGGRLALPVVFGLRRGVAAGRVEIAGHGAGGSRVVWTLEESHLEVHRGSVAVLSLAALPLVAALAWPLWPPLLALAPTAAVLGLAAWWLVVSRLRSSGPEEFFATVGAHGEAGQSSGDSD